MLHRRKIAERKGVRQRPMLAEPFLIISSLNIMKSSSVAAVVTGIDASFGVDLDAEGVAASFGEDFVSSCLGIISPDELAHRVDGASFDPITPHVAGDGAALRGVEPTVGAQSKTVDDGMRVLDAEPFEMDFGIAVGDVVVVSVGIEQEIRRIETQTPPRPRERRGDVQAVDKGLVRSKTPSPSVSSWIVIGRFR